MPKHTKNETDKYSFDGFDIDSLEPPTQEKIADFSFGSPNTVNYPPELFELVDDTVNGPKFNIDQAYDEGINLNAFLEDPKEPVNDLSWLMYPDVKENPTETSHIRDELTRQWVDKKPYKRLDYSQHKSQPACPPLPKISLRDILQKAVRMASEGVPEPAISEYLHPISSMDAVQKTLNIIRAEKELLGRLFIRASVYPNCHKGEWTDKVRSCNSAARYIISAKKCRGCYKNRGGRCDVFKKEIVDMLPWTKALVWYEPIFAEHGIVASGKTPEEKVASLFRSVPYTPKAPANHFPVDYLPEVPLEEAIDEVASYVDKRRVVDISYRNEMKEYENAKSYLDNLKKCRMITPEEHEQILAENEGSPITIMLRARDAVLRAKEVGLYTGPGTDVLLNQFGDHTEEEMLAYLANIDNKQIILDNSHKIIQENKKRATDQISKWIKNKMLTLEQGKAILALDLPPTETILLGKNTILTKGETPTYYGYGSDKIPDPDKLMSLDEAWRNLAKFKNTQQVIDLSYRNKEKEEAEIKNNLQRWMQTGLLSKVAFSFLSNNIGKRPKHEIFSKAAQIIQKNVVQVRNYKGPGDTAQIKRIASSEQVMRELKNLERASKKEEEAMTKLIMDRKRTSLISYISDMSKKGILKQASAEKLTSLAKITSDLKKAFELSMALVRMEMNSPHRPEMKEIEKRDYEGEGVGAIPELDMSMDEAVEEVEHAEEHPSFSIQEIQQAENKLVDLMNKGLSGPALAEELSATGLDNIVEAVPILSQILQTSDGALGILYLDPKPYFTEGLHGCKVGAKTLKFAPPQDLVVHPKCLNCTQNRGNFCNVYGRRLISPDFGEQMKAINKRSPEKEIKYVAELDPSLLNDWNESID